MESGRASAVRAVLATAGLLLASLVQPAAAYAEEPVALVEITLTSMNPALPTPDGEITLTGTVTNITDQPIVGPQAYFWRNQTPIADREGMDRALDSASNDPIGAGGSRPTRTCTPMPRRTWTPDKSAQFTLTAQVADLELAARPARRDLPDRRARARSGNPFAIGRARIFAPIVERTPGEHPDHHGPGHPGLPALDWSATACCPTTTSPRRWRARGG